MTTEIAPWIARQLGALRQRPGPWLLQGPSGLGQLDLALALARVWLCDAPTAAGACGHCASCHQIAAHTHPDLLVLIPDAQREVNGFPASEAGTKTDGRKTRPSRDIRIDAMRGAIEFAQRTSSRGRGKVVVVYPAERMNAATANALLKTLEEPPGDVRFILASEAARALLPTIRSRCLAHTMAWPDTAEAAAWLAQHGVARDGAPAALRAAGGRPGAALALGIQSGWRRQWTELADLLARGDDAALAGLDLPEAVAQLQKLCHDLMLRQVGAAPRFFRADELRAAPLAPAALSLWWRRLGRAARDAEHPLNRELVTEYLLDISHHALHSGPK